MTIAIAERLRQLGLTLPIPAAPIANYVPCLVTGDYLFVSGQLAFAADGRVTTGVVGATLSLADGQMAARLCAVNILAQAQAALGTLDRVRRVVKLTGFVVGGDGFTDHPKVMNGASDLMVEVFGEAGKHTRVAVGVAGLPAGSAVEVDALFWITPN